MTPIVIILPVAYWFLNRLRGTLGPGGVVVGAITGVVIYLFTLNEYLAVGIAIAYAVGEAPGWGRWIKLFNKDWSQEEYWTSHREPKRGKAIHKIANRISPEKKDYKKYAFTAMALRGLLWWLPVALVPTLLGSPESLLVGFLGALTPIPIYMARKKTPFWKTQEHFSGVLHGIILGLLLWTWGV